MIVHVYVTIVVGIVFSWLLDHFLAWSIDYWIDWLNGKFVIWLIDWLIDYDQSAAC